MLTLSASKLQRRLITRALLAATLGFAGALACGSLFTEAPDDGDLFDVPLAGLSPGEVTAFLRGDEEFGRAFTPRDGLGPMFNDVSCANCHSGDGRGDPRNMLARIGEPADGFLAELGGPQIQTRALPGVSPEVIPGGHPVSHRLPPPVFGMGLIEAIPDATILALSDSLDVNGDGVSGRPNWVTPPGYVTSNTAVLPRAIGRFGRKAQVASLLQQVVEAYHQDMGITSEFRPHENVPVNARGQAIAADGAADPEVSVATVESVVHYVRTLAPPAVGAASGNRSDGQALFASVGCANCHTPLLRTGAHPIAALSGRDIALYSDLLLHDMGDGLADLRADGDASGREWRTAPLWGLRLMAQFLNGQSFLLHDGRARTLDEAIRLHGGEAERARNAFVGLSAPQRNALLDFVGSR
jgi:CxxC motif-containing protein (DUF1111 family)